MARTHRMMHSKYFIYLFCVEARNRHRLNIFRVPCSNGRATINLRRSKCQCTQTCARHWTRRRWPKVIIMIIITRFSDIRNASSRTTTASWFVVVVEMEASESITTTMSMCTCVCEM